MSEDIFAMSENIKVRLGNQLETARRCHHWTLNDVARRIGRQPGRISEIEGGKGDGKRPNPEEFFKKLDKNVLLALVPLHRGDIYQDEKIEQATDALTFAAVFRNRSRRSKTSMAARHWATLALGSRFSRIAAKNSRSCNSIPFIDTSTLDTSILFSSPSSRSSYRAIKVPLSQM